MAFSKKLDWVPIVGYGVRETYAQFNNSLPRIFQSPVLSRLLLTPAPDATTGGATAGYPEDTTGVTALRVVGATDHYFAVPNSNAVAGRSSLAVYERIHLGVYDLSDGSVAVPVDDFSSATDAEERFLWDRVSEWDVTQTIQNGAAALVCLTASGTMNQQPPNFVFPPMARQIDITVKRRIEQGTALLYSVQYYLRTAGLPTLADGDVLAATRPHLRTLCRL